jgi:LuxR family transcriptional regulator, maltose regulon positive regulatory protein
MAEPPATTSPAAASAERDVLLATKLHLPRTRPGFVVRPRLTDRLAGAGEGELALVCAPAGFGKTALMADWARRSELPVAWLSLDEADNDPARFWRHAAAALDTVCPGVAERVAGLLGPPPPPVWEGLVTALVNELAGVAEEVVLVVDDYHLIQAPQVHQSVEFLLEHLPACLRLVVASRADPPLPLARLRASGQLAEVRAADLRFTGEEAAELLSGAVESELSDSVVAALEARTEGWAAGLQLAALSLRGYADVNAFVEGFSGSHRYVLDYLAEEVLDRQPEPLREFLLETSILERLSGPLCDAVCGRTDSQELLEQVERANLFLVPLDEVRGWWRFHHLFADLLRARLERNRPERVLQLHRAAAAWHEEHGLADDAIRHAVAAAEDAWAARLVERHAEAVLWRCESATLDRWLAALPADLIHVRPRLSVALAWRAGMTGRMEEVERLLADAERALASAGEEPHEPSVGRAASVLANVGATITLLRATLARMHGDAHRAVEFARQARTQLGDDELLLGSMVGWHLAGADWMEGRLEQAESALGGLVADRRAVGERYFILRGCYDLGQIQQGRGHLGAALQTYRQGLEIAGDAGRQLPAAGIAHVGLADVLRERDELDAALDHARLGVALCGQLAYAQALATGLATLARIRQAKGDAAGALEAIGQAERFELSPGMVALFNPVPAWRARLLLAHGEIDAVSRWVRGCGLAADDEPSYPREREYLVLARVLLAEQPAQALGLLERWHTLAAAQGRTGSVIELRALQALAHAACGDEPRALAALDEALTLAAPEGYLRLFVDEGRPMAELLRKLVADRRLDHGSGAGPREYRSRLVEAFEQAHLPIRPPVRRGAVVVAGLIEPLSARELEVLGLLAAGKPNREIAQELVVTLETVKKHASHIFDKLGVANRTQAVARARELGLMP